MNVLLDPFEMVIPRSTKRQGGTAIGLVIDGGGVVITTGVKGFVFVPFPVTIQSVTILSTDPAVTPGSIVIDIWKVPIANYPPTVANSITGGNPATLTAATKVINSTLPNWTRVIAGGDVLGFNVVSAAAVTRIVLSLAAG